MRRTPRTPLGALCSLALLSFALRAEGAAEPEINPYECLGRYEAATGNRNIAQIRLEIDKRVKELNNPDEPKSVNAMKHCVVAMLMSRTGHGDAPDHYERAVQNAPTEPGYELFWGSHFSMFRGARGPVIEAAERHFYASLAKLEALRKANRYRAYHAVVEEWTRKKLLVLYQQDGLQLIPGKAYPQKPYGLSLPGASASVIASISQDTRDFSRRGDINEMRTFSGEADFANSDLRAGAANRPVVGPGLTPNEIWNIPRAPLRYQFDAKLRLRHNLVGAVDLGYYKAHGEASQITNGYFPDKRSDVDVQDMGLGYERVLPLYPLFDLKVAGNYRRVERMGVVEFLPEEEEKFNLVEGKLALSRFLGADKLTAELGYAFLNIADFPGPNADKLREKHIRSALLEYALYSPLVLPKFEHGSLGAMRTPTRGWYFYAGVVQDDEVYGVRTVSKRDLFGGTRFEGSGPWDLTLQGTYATATNVYAELNSGGVLTEPTQEFSSVRSNVTPQIRFIDPDAIPGIAQGLDSLMLVLPVSHDLGLTGNKDYENIRGGAELWAKLFVTPILGPALLATAGYSYEYFYNIEKGVHIFQANLRLGWGDL